MSEPLFTIDWKKFQALMQKGPSPMAGKFSKWTKIEPNPLNGGFRFWAIYPKYGGDQLWTPATMAGLALKEPSNE